MEEEQDVENIAVDNKVGVSAENNDDLLLKLGKDYAQYMSIDIKKQVSPLNPDFFLIGQIKSHTDFFSQIMRPSKSVLPCGTFKKLPTPQCYLISDHKV